MSTSAARIWPILVAATSTGRERENLYPSLSRPLSLPPSLSLSPSLPPSLSLPASLPLSLPRPALPPSLSPSVPPSLSLYDCIQVLLSRLRLFLSPGYPYEDMLKTFHNQTDIIMCSYLPVYTSFNQTRGLIVILISTSLYLWIFQFINLIISLLLSTFFSPLMTYPHGFSDGTMQEGWYNSTMDGRSPCSTWSMLHF